MAIEYACKPGSLDAFHFNDSNGFAKGVYDYAIFLDICKKHPLFISNGIIFLYQQGYFKPDFGQARLCALVKEHIYPQLVRAPTIKRVASLFFQDNTLQVDQGMINRQPKHFICFKNGLYDPIEKKMHPHDPLYRITNQVPAIFYPSRPVRGKRIETWLDSILQPDDKEMLLQFAGYCLTSDASQQKMLLLTGPGGTGKSTILNMIQAIVGSENTSNVPLSSIATNRFSTAPMFGKLLNCNGDQKISALEDVSLVKQLVGEDVVNAEFKGKDQFSFRSYAKQIFSVNGFPLIKGEASDAIYRRLLILEVAKKPPRLDPNFQRFLLEEADDFLTLAVRALERMFAANGRILESKRSQELVQEYRRRSDTVAAFLSDTIEESGQSDYIRKQVLFDEYVKYCAENERTSLKKKAFVESMHIKGYPEKTLDGNKVFRGLKFKDLGFANVGKEQIPF